MKKEDILANCIDEVLAGKCTVEDCLAKYSQLGDELRPLLKIALSIQSEAVTPSPEFRQRARKRLIEAIQPAVAPAERRGLDIFGWLRPLARRTAVAIVVAALLVGGGATAYAAQESMPDEVLYPVKVATENARLAVTPSDVGKAELHIAFAERRVQEMAEMGRRGEAGEIPGLAVALDYHLEQASDLMEMASAEGVDVSGLEVSLAESATQQLGALEGTLDEVPEEAKSAIAQALETSGEDYSAAIEAVAGVEAVAVPAPSPAPRAPEGPMLMVADMGTIQVRATDPPPPKADSVLVEVGQIEIHRIAGPDTGWLTVINEPVTFDLLKIAEVQKFLGTQEVPSGTYTQLRFIITKATVVVDGEEHDVHVPSGELNLVRPFQVEKGGITVILLDFDGIGSLYVTGGGRFMMKPKVNMLVPPTGEGDKDKEEGAEVEIEGAVASFTGNDLVLVVAGQEVMITLDKLTEIKGDLEIDAWVEVGAVTEDGTFLAKEVKIKEAEQEQERERGREMEGETGGGVGGKVKN